MTKAPAPRRCDFTVLAAIAAIAAITASAGCGVPTEAGARVLPSSDLPPALVAPLVAKAAPQLPIGNGHGFVDVPVYFLYANNTELRQVPSAVRQPVTLQAVLRALEAGPSAKLYATGYATAVPSNTNLRVIGQPVRGVLKVALDSTYYQLSEQLAILELAQVVYTLERAPGDVKSVQFYRNGAKAGVLAGNGQFVPGAVSRKDYASVFIATD